MKLLVPTDFSKNANTAVECAVSVAQKLGDEIILFHAFHPMYVEQRYTGNTTEKTRVELQRQLDDKKKDLQETFPNLKIHTELRLGFIVESVEEMVEEDSEIKMIVMGTQGANGIGDLLLGSNTTGVINSVDVPVMSVPNNCSFTGVGKIVYATDLQHKYTETAKQLTQITKDFGAELICLHVYTENEETWETYSWEDFQQIHPEISQIENVKFETLSHNDIIVGLNYFVEENHIDMLVVSRKKRSFFNRLFHKSVSRNVALHAQVPLLTIKE